MVAIDFPVTLKISTFAPIGVEIETAELKGFGKMDIARSRGVLLSHSRIPVGSSFTKYISNVSGGSGGVRDLVSKRGARFLDALTASPTSAEICFTQTGLKSLRVARLTWW